MAEETNKPVYEQNTQGGTLPAGTDGNPLLPNMSVTRDPPQKEVTGKQSMLFQPSNTAVMAGVVGIGGWDSCAWTDWTRGTSLPGPYNNPSPMLTSYSINGIPTAWPGQYTYFRKILNDPTIRFVRMLAYAPVLASQWSIQASKNAPKEAHDLIYTMFDSLRAQYLDDALRGVDYGWAPFEQVFTYVSEGPYAGSFWLKKLKALLHDVTTLYVTKDNDLAGFNNNGDTVDLVKSLLYTHDGESGNLYGRGRCNNLLLVLPWWNDANEGALRYDRKIAGVFMVCHYPPGQSIGRRGTLQENWEIAKELLEAVEAGRPIAVCNEFAGEMMDNYLANISMADRTRWKLELLEDNGSRQPGFGDRLAYLDRQKARGWLVPERSAFEAQKSGSKADSESHGDILLVQGNVINEALVNILNGSPIEFNSPVNNVLRVNYGPKAVGTVKLVFESLSDDKKKFIREIAAEVIRGDPNFLSRVSDVRQVFEQAGLPTPSDPLDNKELLVELDGMVAKRVETTGPSPGDGGEEGRKTLSRLRTGLNGHMHGL